MSCDYELANDGRAVAGKTWEKLNTVEPPCKWPLQMLSQGGCLWEVVA